MTFFQDLSPYSYLNSAHPDTVNIGWLDPAHPFTKRTTSKAFRTRLQELCEHCTVNQTRGLHWCCFCKGKNRPAGSAEIHVSGPDGYIYAAPSLIGHYTCEHDYYPPRIFIGAVLRGQPISPPESPEYEEMLAAVLLEQANALLAGEPKKAGAKLRWIVQGYAGTNAAEEARKLLTAQSHRGTSTRSNTPVSRSSAVKPST